MKPRQATARFPAAWWVLPCAGLCLIICACSTFEHAPVVMVPSPVPGAEYVGPETCSTSDCHQSEHRFFQLNKHASVAIKISDEDAEAGQAEACETCHGPGSVHVENRGRKSGDILVRDPAMCFACHFDVKGKFMLQHHHPVPEGRMFCSDCHNMHGSDVAASGGAMLLGENEKCFGCHKEMRGPFVFEHDAIRDGCASCHNPHGSINDKLLVAGQTVTCLRCHWEPAFNTSSASLGGHEHSSHAIGAGQDCVDCHPAVHGSNVWRSLRQ
ncbi:MAG: cytochrome c3 family protein [Planctomycetota bacterium]